MIFTFRKKQQKGFCICPCLPRLPIDGNDEFLPYEVGDEMFLCGIDRTYLPQNPDFLEEWV